jgi:hypothetical protein
MLRRVPYSEVRAISNLHQISFFTGFTDSRLVTPPPNIKEEFFH